MDGLELDPIPRGAAHAGIETHASAPTVRRGVRTRTLRAVARLSSRFGWMVLALPPLLVLALDLDLRGARLAELRGKYVFSYLAALLESAALWGILLLAASARRGAARWVTAFVFVVLGAMALGSQRYFHAVYSTYLNLDATLFGTSVVDSLFGQIRADLHHLAAALAPPLLVAILLVVVARIFLRPRPRAARLARVAAPFALAAVFLIPCSYRRVQASTPDVIYFHALGGLMRELADGRAAEHVRPGLRRPEPVPPLHPRPPAPRNVLFILTESVRHDEACSAFVETCPAAPFSNAAAPGRIPLRQMRANTSTTAISLAVLWTGLEPSASREALHTAPVVFDYARAAGYDAAYWTSHHMMFANSRLWVRDLPTSHQCGATDLDPLADIDLGAHDELLVERVKRDLGELREPFLAVVHPGNSHLPYRVDPEHAPFQPSSPSKDPERTEEHRNYYRNAVYLSDRAVGDLVRFVRSTPAGARTVIVYTSDHGEAFREHGQLGHTSSVYDEEIRVPFWIDAPPGLLSPGEIDAVRAAEWAPTFHLDVAPTLLDLLGVWDDPGLGRFRAAMPGTSLLRPERTTAPVVLTNCSGVWGCALRNWGMMQGWRKLEAREWDRDWHCFDVLSDPAEARDQGPEACQDLVPLARVRLGSHPGAP